MASTTKDMWILRQAVCTLLTAVVLALAPFQAFGDSGQLGIELYASPFEDVQVGSNLECGRTFEVTPFPSSTVSCYVRCIPVLSVNDQVIEKPYPPFDSADWVYAKDGCFYYKHPLNPGEVAHIDTTIAPSVMADVFKTAHAGDFVEVKEIAQAQAIQADAVTPDFTSERPWGDAWEMRDVVKSDSKTSSTIPQLGDGQDAHLQAAGVFAAASLLVLVVLCAVKKERNGSND